MLAVIEHQEKLPCTKVPAHGLHDVLGTFRGGHAKSYAYRIRNQIWGLQWGEVDECRAIVKSWEKLICYLYRKTRLTNTPCPCESNQSRGFHQGDDLANLDVPSDERGERNRQGPLL